MADVHVYVNRPVEKESEGLEDLEAAISRLDHVSRVVLRPSENLVAVAYDGGKAEQAEIERAVEEAGYEVSRVSVRSDFPEETSLWDI